jgi:hypothetical protein
MVRWLVDDQPVLAVDHDLLPLEARGPVPPESPRGETHQSQRHQVHAERSARGRPCDERSPERECQSKTHDQPQTDKSKKQRHSADNAAQFACRKMNAGRQVFPNQGQPVHCEVEVIPRARSQRKLGSIR